MMSLPPEPDATMAQGLPMWREPDSEWVRAPGEGVTDARNAWPQSVKADGQYDGSQREMPPYYTTKASAERRFDRNYRRAQLQHKRDARQRGRSAERATLKGARGGAAASSPSPIRAAGKDQHKTTHARSPSPANDTTAQPLEVAPVSSSAPASGPVPSTPIEVHETLKAQQAKLARERSAWAERSAIQQAAEREERARREAAAAEEAEHRARRVEAEKVERMHVLAAARRRHLEGASAEARAAADRERARADGQAPTPGGDRPFEVRGDKLRDTHEDVPFGERARPSSAPAYRRGDELGEDRLQRLWAQGKVRDEFAAGAPAWDVAMPRLSGADSAASLIATRYRQAKAREARRRAQQPAPSRRAVERKRAARAQRLSAERKLMANSKWLQMPRQKTKYELLKEAGKSKPMTAKKQARAKAEAKARELAAAERRSGRSPVNTSPLRVTAGDSGGDAAHSQLQSRSPARLDVVTPAAIAASTESVGGVTLTGHADVKATQAPVEVDRTLLPRASAAAAAAAAKHTGEMGRTSSPALVPPTVGEVPPSMSPLVQEQMTDYEYTLLDADRAVRDTGPQSNVMPMAETLHHIEEKKAAAAPREVRYLQLDHLFSKEFFDSVGKMPERPTAKERREGRWRAAMTIQRFRRTLVEKRKASAAGRRQAVERTEARMLIETWMTNRGEELMRSAASRLMKNQWERCPATFAEIPQLRRALQVPERRKASTIKIAKLRLWMRRMLRHLHKCAVIEHNERHHEAAVLMLQRLARCIVARQRFEDAFSERHAAASRLGRWFRHRHDIWALICEAVVMRTFNRWIYDRQRRAKWARWRAVGRTLSRFKILVTAATTKKETALRTILRAVRRWVLQRKAKAWRLDEAARRQVSAFMIQVQWYKHLRKMFKYRVMNKVAMYGIASLRRARQRLGERRRRWAPVHREMLRYVSLWRYFAQVAAAKAVQRVFRGHRDRSWAKFHAAHRLISVMVVQNAYRKYRRRLRLRERKAKVRRRVRKRHLAKKRWAATNPLRPRTHRTGLQGMLNLGARAAGQTLATQLLGKAIDNFAGAYLEDEEAEADYGPPSGGMWLGEAVEKFDRKVAARAARLDFEKQTSADQEHHGADHTAVAVARDLEVDDEGRRIRKGVMMDNAARSHTAIDLKGVSQRWRAEIKAATVIQWFVKRTFLRRRLVYAAAAEWELMKIEEWLDENAIKIQRALREHIGWVHVCAGRIVALFRGVTYRNIKRREARNKQVADAKARREEKERTVTRFQRRQAAKKRLMVVYCCLKMLALAWRTKWVIYDRNLAAALQLQKHNVAATLIQNVWAAFIAHRARHRANYEALTKAYEARWREWWAIGTKARTTVDKLLGHAPLQRGDRVVARYFGGPKYYPAVVTHCLISHEEVAEVVGKSKDLKFVKLDRGEIVYRLVYKDTAVEAMARRSWIHLVQRPKMAPEPDEVPEYEDVYVKPNALMKAADKQINWKKWEAIRADREQEVLAAHRLNHVFADAPDDKVGIIDVRVIVGEKENAEMVAYMERRKKKKKRHYETPALDLRGISRLGKKDDNEVRIWYLLGNENEHSTFITDLRICSASELANKDPSPYMQALWDAGFRLMFRPNRLVGDVLPLPAFKPMKADFFLVASVSDKDPPLTAIQASSRVYGDVATKDTLSETQLFNGGFSPLPEDMGLFGCDAGIKLWLAWATLKRGRIAKELRRANKKLATEDVDIVWRRPPVRRDVAAHIKEQARVEGVAEDVLPLSRVHREEELRKQRAALRAAAIADKNVPTKQVFEARATTVPFRSQSHVLRAMVEKVSPKKSVRPGAPPAELADLMRTVSEARAAAAAGASGAGARLLGDAGRANTGLTEADEHAKLLTDGELDAIAEGRETEADGDEGGADETKASDEAGAIVPVSKALTLLPSGRVAAAGAAAGAGPGGAAGAETLTDTVAALTRGGHLEDAAILALAAGSAATTEGEFERIMRETAEKKGTPPKAGADGKLDGEVEVQRATDARPVEDEIETGQYLANVREAFKKAHQNYLVRTEEEERLATEEEDAWREARELAVKLREAEEKAWDATANVELGAAQAEAEREAEELEQRQIRLQEALRQRKAAQQATISELVIKLSGTWTPLVESIKFTTEELLKLQSMWRDLREEGSAGVRAGAMDQVIEWPTSLKEAWEGLLDYIVGMPRHSLLGFKPWVEWVVRICLMRKNSLCHAMFVAFDSSGAGNFSLRDLRDMVRALHADVGKTKQQQLMTVAAKVMGMTKYYVGITFSWIDFEKLIAGAWSTLAPVLMLQERLQRATFGQQFWVKRIGPSTLQKDIKLKIPESKVYIDEVFRAGKEPDVWVAKAKSVMLVKAKRHAKSVRDLMELRPPDKKVMGVPGTRLKDEGLRTDRFARGGLGPGGW